MDWLEVLKRIEQGESEQTEFKRQLGNVSDLGKEICAFANTDGGLLIIGVDDDGTIFGVDRDPDDFQERLSSFLQTGLSAPVSARIDRYEDPNGWVHWIEVRRMRGFEPLSHKGKVYVRRARNSVEPSSSELQDLFNRFGYILTEEQVIAAATENDIDQEKFRGFLETLGIGVDVEPQPALEQDLVNRGVMSELEKELRPTLYGVMAFGNNPQQFPQTVNFWVECVAYDGEDHTADATITGRAKGTLDEQVTSAVAWVSNLKRTESHGGLFRGEHGLVPGNALREVVVNAVAHRDYAITGSKILLEVFSNRLVVTSPGSFPNHMTVEKVMAGGLARSRNEAMANFLVVRRLMEQRGRGWPVIRRAMREFNGTEPELEQDRDNRYVRATLWLQ